MCHHAKYILRTINDNSLTELKSAIRYTNTGNISKKRLYADIQMFNTKYLEMYNVQCMLVIVWFCVCMSDNPLAKKLV